MWVMEAPCDYFMYFPSVPISSLSDLAEYATLPRRSHVYLGEIVQFLLVLRFRKQQDGADRSRHGPLRDLAGTLSAKASACIAEDRCQGDPRSHDDDVVSDQAGHIDTGSPNRSGSEGDSGRPFRQCGVAIAHSSASERQQSSNEIFKVRRRK